MPQGVNAQPSAVPERLIADIGTLRERMLTAHYYEESHWLAAAVAFPRLCQSPVGQDALRRAATVAWQFGFAAVSHWINSEVLVDAEPNAVRERRNATIGAVRLPPEPDPA